MASAVSFTPPVPAYTADLASLVANNGTLTIGDKIFSNFDYLATNLTSFDPSKITVTASVDMDGVYYLTYAGNISLVSGSGPVTADLLLNYTVTATAGQIVMIDQYYAGSAQGTNGAFLAVDETARVGPVVVANSHLMVGDLSDPPAEFGIGGDNLNINPGQTTLDVTKDISLGLVDGGLITISKVAQSFHQGVPDGGSTVALLGIALAAVEGVRWTLRGSRRREERR